MSNFFKNNDTKTAREAQYEAQRIAFAPIIFQVAKTMRDLGILNILYINDKTGITINEISEELKLTTYGIQTLLETSLSADIVKVVDDKYFITKTGFFLLKDEMTRINMNYNHYVNYQGLYYLEDAIKNTKASGLKVFGDWETIYPALSSLPEQAQKSWFEFDHYYSDTAFKEAIEILLSYKPKRILDIGGNTGKFSINLAKKDSTIQITIMDLPEQIVLATNNIKQAGLENQLTYIPINILEHTRSIPSGYDIVWMSQFLDCFKEDDIVQVLQRVKNSLGENSYVFIMEPLWDKQQVEAGAFCIINTSPYFTAMANGYSKMFHSKDMTHYINQSGLKIVNQIHNVGICQSILICKAFV